MSTQTGLPFTTSIRRVPTYADDPRIGPETRARMKSQLGYAFRVYATLSSVDYHSGDPAPLAAIAK